MVPATTPEGAGAAIGIVQVQVDDDHVDLGPVGRHPVPHVFYMDPGLHAQPGADPLNDDRVVVDDADPDRFGGFRHRTSTHNWFAS